MDDLIDFTNCEKTKKNYEGANGSKMLYHLPFSEGRLP